MKKTSSTTYTYHFIDGTEYTVQMDLTEISGASSINWISELEELDRLENNNQHTESRRHSSLDAQEPMGKDGYFEGDHMDHTLLKLEVEDFLNALPSDLKRIAILLMNGFSASEVARLDNIHRSSVSRQIQKIRLRMKEAGF